LKTGAQKSASRNQEVERRTVPRKWNFEKLHQAWQSLPQAHAFPVAPTTCKIIHQTKDKDSGRRGTHE